MTAPARCLVPAVALALVAGMALLSAQTPQQPVFRAGATFVTVDVYPTIDGRVVEGLEARDFQVLENGKPQVVETVEFIRVAPPVSVVDRREPENQRDGDRMAANPRARIFVIYLDMFHVGLSGWHAARQPLVQFISEQLGPEDLFAVMTPEKSVAVLEFSRRLGTLEAELARANELSLAMESVGGRVVRRTSMEDRVASCAQTSGEMDLLVRLYRDELLLTSLENLVGRLDGLRDSRKDVIFLSEGWVPFSGRVALSGGGTLSPPPPLGGTRSGFGGRGASDVITSPESVNDWCSLLRGRIGADQQRRFAELLRMARGANVAFHTIDVGGLQVGLSFADASLHNAPNAGAGFLGGNRRRTDTLRTLAEETNGFAVVNTNGIDAGLTRISDALSSHYLIGYYTTNTTRDGAFREITVKVNRPRVSIAARRGYFAPTDARTPPAVVTAAPSPLAPIATAALAKLAAARPESALFTYAAASSSGLDIVVELASRHLSLGRWTRGADVDTEITMPSGEVRRARASIDPGARGALLRVPVAAGSGPWRVAVRVAHGEERLEDRVVVPNDSWALVGAPLLFRTGTARAATRPVADFTFRALEGVRLVWPISLPLDATSARVLDRHGRPLPIPIEVRQSGDGEPALVADLSMSSLGIGDYVLDLEAWRGDRVERRAAAFRVVR